jgi:MoaA/NifB/PqqE/SkfB family radical SAM enzyme
MSKLFDCTDIKVLHIEPTTVCNAACPQCHREDLSYYDHDIHQSELTVEQCKNLFASEFIKNLNKMFMCGNFGEPAAGRDTLDIYRYFRQINPTITLGMNTNGSVRNNQWWEQLAGIFFQNFDYVVFSIDGLEDTNHIYRQGVSWRKLIENAKAFIDAGGTAHWDMLVFEHNQHQVDECKQLAADLGFSWFRAKVSKRFNANTVDWIKPPANYSLPNVTVDGDISCHALNEKSIYVAANGEVLPCCWFGAEAFTLDLYAKQLVSDWKLLKNSWNNAPHRICKSTCVNDSVGNSFTKQWKIEEQLK